MDMEAGVEHLGRATVRGVDAMILVVEPGLRAVSYTHLRAHETVLDLVCRLLLEKKNIHYEDAILSQSGHSAYITCNASRDDRLVT